MALSINSKGTIPIQNVTGSTFTAKLQNAGSSALYPEGTVFDCSAYKTDSILSTVVIRRAGTTFLFGEGDFTMSASGQNMFDIQAPNVTIIGVSRSAKDSVTANGSTRFVMTSTNGGYHIITTPNSGNGWVSADSLTLMNIDLVGVKSAYTSSGGTVSYSTQGSGGILLTEGNPDASGSNLNNVWINEVLIDGTRGHGIMMYGGMASKIQNTRVRNAGGHGFYIAGSTTSTSLDTCYASGCYLAGFSIHDTSYSTLSNCASDSNGLGYWMRNANSVTMSSCGAEANQVRSSIPNNLGITLPAQAGTVTINDIGSDNVNFIKGTSFLFIGGENITGTSCYSKDPGNRAGLSTFLSKYTAHVHGAYGTEKVNMDNFKAAGDSPTKYLYRLQDVYNFHIDDLVNQYDPTNPTESPDGSMTNVAQILDQGDNNIFGDESYSNSWYGRRLDIGDPESNFRVNQLEVPGRLSIPVEPAHPANPQSGTIYFNNVLKKLYMFDGTNWFDTCCATAPTPPPTCVFPNGGLQTAAVLFNTGNITSPRSVFRVGNKVYIWGPLSSTNAKLTVFDIDQETLIPLITQDTIQFPSTGFAQFTNKIAYSETTNSIYFGLTDSGPSQNNIGGTTFLYKYNLTTQTIDASIGFSDMTTPQAANPNNLFGNVFMNFFVYDDKLWTVYSQDNYMKTCSRDLTTLAEISTADGTTAYPFQGLFTIDQVIDHKINNLNLEASSGQIIVPGSNLISGEAGKFYAFDITNCLMYEHVYDSSVTSENIPGGVNFFSSDTETTFFISDGERGKTYEIEYGTYNVINIFDVFGNGLSVREINSNRILFYATQEITGENSQGLYITQTIWKAYNLTTNEPIEGSILISTGTAGSGFPISKMVCSMGPVVYTFGSTTSDFIYFINYAVNIGKTCAPYAS